MMQDGSTRSEQYFVMVTARIVETIGIDAQSLDCMNVLHLIHSHYVQNTMIIKVQYIQCDTTL
jgi:hypothetical protein